MPKNISFIPVEPLGDERFAVIQFRLGQPDTRQLLTNCTNGELDEARVVIVDAIKCGATPKKSRTLKKARGFQ